MTPTTVAHTKGITNIWMTASSAFPLKPKISVPDVTRSQSILYVPLDRFEAVYRLFWSS